ncbi:agmatinase [Oceanobacillus jeddahense]|uniref:agmatinase n=1 Tax=Oceanobacillus jeddahense TaxID=1462527 RepID=UPI00059620DA|nr:agmatinase [Oceanobacillus jeddahense]
MVKENEKETLNLPFVGISSFGKYPICENLDQLQADVAILGIPYDMGTQWRSGTKMGPRGIREASTLFSFGLKGAYDPERDDMYLTPQIRINDCGDVDMVHGDLEQCFDNIENSVRKIVSGGAMPVLLGGDHSITIPFARGLESLGPFHVIQIDAHLDWADHRSGQRLGQGSPIRRMSEMSHVKGITSLGIRGVGSSRREDFEDARNYGNVIISPKNMREMGLKEVINQLPEGERFFVTIDIDGLDPSISHGTGTPSPGGLFYDEINEILEGIAKRGDVIAFDLVEVSPPYDPTGVTCITAARTIMDFIMFITKEREKKGQLISQSKSVNEQFINK